MHTKLGTTATVLLLLGACSNSSGDDSEAAADAEPYIDTLATTLSEDDGSNATLDDTTAACIAEAIVETVGADTLADADISPVDLEVAGDLTSLNIEIPDDTTDSLTTDLDDCGFGDFLESAVIDGVATTVGSELSGEATTCVSGYLDSEDLSAAAARTFIDQSRSHELEQMAIPAVNSCPDALAANVADAFVAQLDTELTNDAQACLEDYVDANFEAVTAGILFSQDDDPARGINIGLATACPQIASD